MLTAPSTRTSVASTVFRCAICLASSIHLFFPPTLAAPSSNCAQLCVYSPSPRRSQGYPTIKYGDPNNLEDYQGGRSFEDLQTFAKENLGPSCGPANLDLCDAEQKKAVEEALALDAAALDAKIAEGEKKMEDAESTFKSEVEKLQAKYESLQKEKDETIANVKKSGLGMLKSVKAHKAK